MKSLKLKRYPGENVTYCCAAILVDYERLEISSAFKPEHLGYIDCIIEDTSDSIFCMWGIHNYKVVTEFIKKLCNLLLLLNSPQTEYGVKSILKDASDVP